METVGQAAARLLARLERAAKAKEIERDRLSVVRDAVPASTTDAQPAPDTRAKTSATKDRTANAMPRGLEIRMRLPLALGRGGEDGPSSRLAAPVRPACNDNRRDHAEALRTGCSERASTPFSSQR